MNIKEIKDGFEPHPLVNTGAKGQLFWIAFGRMLVTILTLGIGRFWMATRLRRYHWSAFQLDEQPFEYTGTAVEKLVGFLIAVAILAVYLTIVNLALTFVGLSYFQGSAAALNISILAVVPLAFWAQYRARRYILARTRWRGIRFGVEPGAWGYTLRAMLWWMLTIATLGLAYPWQQLALAKFTTDRTWFGNLRFTQHGSVWPLFRSWLLVIAPLLLVAAFGAFQWREIWAEIQTIDLMSGEDGLRGRLDETTPVATGLGTFAILGAIWAYALYIRHSIFSFRYLNSHKLLAGATAFDFRLGFWQVVGVYVFGSLIIAVLSSLVFMLAAILALMLFIAAGVIDPDLFQSILEGRFPAAEIAFLGAMAVPYFVWIVAFVSLGQAFITLPMMRLIARTTEVYGMEELARAQQRARDEQVEAGGFADALGADVGGAF